MKFRLISQFVFAVAALSVLALLLMPVTSATVRQHLKFGFGGGIFTLNQQGSDSAEQLRTVQAIVSRAPNDFQLQFAAALQNTSFAHADSTPNLKLLTALAQLTERFPQEPAACAAYLRYASAGGPGRDLEQELFQYATLDDASQAREKRLKGAHPVGYWEAHPDFVAQYARIAERGARLEPDNAYFAFAQASALLSRKQDADAEKALARAARASCWREYTNTETEAMLALRTAQWGPLPGISQGAIAAAQLFPQYAFDRSVARTFGAQAILAEQSGDAEHGFQIRHNLSRIGALMRRDSTNTIGCLVGIAMVQSAALRPGGSLPLKSTVVGYSKMESKQRTALAQSNYTAYLAQTGHLDEAKWFTDETQQEEKARSITGRGLAKNEIFGPSVLQSVVWMAVCYILLANLLWMLLAGGVASWVARGPRIRDAAPLHHATKLALGVAASVVVLCTVIGYFIWGKVSTESVVFILLAFGAWLALPLLILWRKPLGTGREMSRDQRVAEARRGVKIYGKVIGQCLAVLAVVAGTIPAIVVGPISIAMLFSGMSTGNEGGESWTHSGALLVVWLSAVLLIGWLGILTVSIVRSIRRRVPASVGITLAFRGAALPFASILLFAYAAAAVHTAQVDAAANREIAQNIAHEGRYFASLLGETWPDLVSEDNK